MSLEKKIVDLWEEVSGKKLLSKGRKYLIHYIKASEYKKGEHLKNLGKFAINFSLTYRVLGSLPYKIQDSLTSEAGINRIKLTAYSAAFGVQLGMAKRYGAGLFDEAPIIGYGAYALKGYGYYCIFDAFFRFPYTMITKKSLGMLDFELLYLFLPSKFKHLKSNELEFEITTA